MSSNLNSEMGLRTDRLRIAREKRGLTQRDLSRLTGLSINQIHRYENGIADPSTPILSAIANQLAVTTDYLLGLSDIPEGNIQLDLRNDERQLLDAYTVGDSTTIFKLVTDRLRQLEGESGDG